MDSFFSGKKTYIFAFLIGATAVLHYLGYIDDESFKTIEVVLTSGSLASIRSAVKKIDTSN